MSHCYRAPRGDCLITFCARRWEGKKARLAGWLAGCDCRLFLSTFRNSKGHFSPKIAQYMRANAQSTHEARARSTHTKQAQVRPPKACIASHKAFDPGYYPRTSRRLCGEDQPPFGHVPMCNTTDASRCGQAVPKTKPSIKRVSSAHGDQAVPYSRRESQARHRYPFLEGSGQRRKLNHLHGTCYPSWRAPTTRHFWAWLRGSGISMAYQSNPRAA